METGSSRSPFPFREGDFGDQLASYQDCPVGDPVLQFTAIAGGWLLARLNARIPDPALPGRRHVARRDVDALMRDRLRNGKSRMDHRCLRIDGTPGQRDGGSEGKHQANHRSSLH